MSFDWLPPIRISPGRFLASATYSAAVFQGALGRVQSRNSSKAMAATGFSSSYFQPTLATSGSIHSLLVPNTILCGSPVADLTYTKPSAPEPPPLLRTTMGWVMSLYLTMMDCTVRAKMSVPPPAPDATTNSTGRVGCQSAAMAAMGRSIAAKARAATIFLMRDPPSLV